MIVQGINQNWEQTLLSMVEEARHYSSETSIHGYHSGDQALELAYERCQFISSRYSRSFHLASQLLPREKRRSIRALYAFCRIADDIVDGSCSQPEIELERLKRVQVQVIHSPNDSRVYDEVLPAWKDTRFRYQIPLIYAQQLLDGIGQDLYKKRYHSFEELAVYCYGVASTVGLMSMHVIGFEAGATSYAVKLGVALQLTNILRDVGEDWRSGRLYLPLDELAAFGLSEEEFASWRGDNRWRDFMAFQIERARQLYAEALPGIRLLNPDGRFAVTAAGMFYQAILDDIEEHDYDVFRRRARVSDWGKIRRLFGIFRQSRHPGFQAAPG